MDLAGKIAVVTGAAGGIGRALAEAFAQEGAQKVVCADINEAGAAETAAKIGGYPIAADLATESGVQSLIETVEANVGPIDLFCCNAGVAISGGLETPDAHWETSWNINVMAHVWAARHLVPRMASRGGGYFLNTASAAGLLNQVGAVSYGVTKHAAVGFSEWLAMSHADDGIKVSLLCPQAVRTGMLQGNEDHAASVDGIMEPSDVARVCVDAIRDELSLVLPHENVREYMRRKATDYDRWINGMKKLNRSFGELV